MHWTDSLHKSLISISDQITRLDVDARLLSESGEKLDRALYPLLSRINLRDSISVAELANLVGRDHSTVSRQSIKLERLGLILRTHSSVDRRVILLATSDKGRDLVSKIARVRRIWMEEHFKDWSDQDRDLLISLMAQMVEQSTAYQS